MYKICVYVPEKSVEDVKKSLFDAGAGKIGNYDSCCWQTPGTGQFRPLENSDPTVGLHNRVERLAEVKIELVCEDELVKAAVEAIRQSHPYEEPAINVWRLAEL